MALYRRMSPLSNCVAHAWQRLFRCLSAFLLVCPLFAGLFTAAQTLPDAPSAHKTKQSTAALVAGKGWPRTFSSGWTRSPCTSRKWKSGTETESIFTPPLR